MESSNRRKQKERIDLSTLVYGKVPPQAKDLEDFVLGSMLLPPHSVIDVIDILLPEDFYVYANQVICSAIYAVYQGNVPDILLVVEELKKMGKLDEVGGPYAVMKLTNSVTTTINIKKYCRLIKEKSVQRRLIEFAGVILNDAYEDTGDVFDLLGQAESKLSGINSELSSSNITKLSTIALSVIEKFDNKVYNARNNIIDPNLVYTGFKEWDDVNGSLFPGLYVIAGRPGMGKGVHMTEMICRMAKDVEIGVINGEMTDEQLLTRIGCNLLNIDNYLFKKNPLFITDEEQSLVKDAMEEALSLKIRIENNRFINKIANKIKYWVKNDGVKCVLADFLTLFKVPEELGKYFTATQRVDYVLDVFVGLCKDLKIPIILYVQMNREILGRHGSKEPNLADLKQSGSIEELAFQVSFLHRPEYYDSESITDEFGESTKGLMYQILAKHRDGKLGRFKYKSVLECSQLKTWGNSFDISNLEETPF